MSASHPNPLAFIPDYVERKGSLFLRSDHMDYGRPTLVSNWWVETLSFDWFRGLRRFRYLSSSLRSSSLHVRYRITQFATYHNRVRYLYLVAKLKTCVGEVVGPFTRHNFVYLCMASYKRRDARQPTAGCCMFVGNNIKNKAYW